MAKPEACELYIEQQIEEGLQEGRTPYSIGKELSDWVAKLFEVRIKPTTLEKRADRHREKLPTNVGKESDNESIDEEIAENGRIELGQETNRGGKRESSGRPHKQSFNKTNSNIEWAKWTWNPVTGCKHGCKYCYARDIANRFYAEKFEPTFRPERLTAPKDTPLPIESDNGNRNVFVCSMADLFGNWVPQEWIDAVLESVTNAPEWNFIFLTKNPERMVDINWPDNAIVGATIDEQDRVHRTEMAFMEISAKSKFISCEPLSEELRFDNLNLFDCIIIGARSKSFGMPEMQPNPIWTLSLALEAKRNNCEVFIKPNLDIGFLKQYPTRGR